MIEQLKQAITVLPRISDGLPGIGGTLKTIPEHFQVEEILPYAPCGQGEHVYLTLRRAGWNTEDAAGNLARTFAIKPMDVGWGGRKDKQAVTTQTFSLLLPMHMTFDHIRDELAGSPFEVLAVNRHRNKIKTGHVAGNRFRIYVHGTVGDALERTRPIIERLTRCGIPNYFGPQRFGHNLSNLDRAGTLLASGKSVKGRKNRFFVSALQAALFNQWLAERIRRDEYDRILDGDVAQKTDTGGLFVVDDPDEAGQRFRQGAIVYTGPMFGHKMMAGSSDAGRHEIDLMERFGLTREVFKTLRAKGSRRAAILRAADLAVEAVEQGVQFSFSLPSGAYATTVLREFMHDPPADGAARPPDDETMTKR